MFTFKQFSVKDDRCAMKVGTDGTLLGAWAGKLFLDHHPHLNTDNPNAFILDIGTGSGLISLMLAQQLPFAHIMAIDIDADATVQASENFIESPWPDRLHALHCSLQEYHSLVLASCSAGLGNMPNNQSAYLNKCDFIVSNPPFFVDSLKNPNLEKQAARHTDSLPFSELISISSQLLKENGMLALVLPAEAENRIRLLAATSNLLPVAVTHVCTKAGKMPKRVLIAFQKQSANNHENQPNTVHTTLNLMGLDGAPRSQEYRLLTQDFYL